MRRGQRNEQMGESISSFRTSKSDSYTLRQLLLKPIVPSNILRCFFVTRVRATGTVAGPSGLSGVAPLPLQALHGCFSRLFSIEFGIVEINFPNRYHFHPFSWPRKRERFSWGKTRRTCSANILLFISTFKRFRSAKSRAI